MCFTKYCNSAYLVGQVEVFVFEQEEGFGPDLLVWVPHPHLAEDGRALGRGRQQRLQHEIHCIATRKQDMGINTLKRSTHNSTCKIQYSLQLKKY